MNATTAATANVHEIARDRSIPIWKRLESAIAGEIRNGGFAPGARLPSAQEFAARFGVNRLTVRRALDELADRGLIRTEKGSGSYVHEQPYPYPITQRTRFTPAMNGLSASPRKEIIALRTEMPSRAVMKALGAQGNRVHRIEYVSLVEERPIDVSTAWFPAARFPDLLRVFERTLSVTRTLAEFGVHDYLRDYTAVMARLPTPEIARRLHQSPRRPVLFTRSINVDVERVPVQYGETLFAGDWIQLEMRNG